MASIINVTRTYRFADGIPLSNSQLDVELSNIIDRVNKNISFLTSNVYVQSFVADSIPTAFPSSGIFGDLTSISVGQGEWYVNAMIGIIPLDNLVSKWSAGVGYSSGNHAFNTYITGQDGIPGPSFGLRSYITIPPFRASALTSETIYLKFSATYTGSTPFGFGVIQALRFNT